MLDRHVCNVLAWAQSWKPETAKWNTHLDSLKSLRALMSCWTVKRTLLWREGHLSILLRQDIFHNLFWVLPGSRHFLLLHQWTSLVGPREISQRQKNGLWPIFHQNKLGASWAPSLMLNRFLRKTRLLFPPAKSQVGALLFFLINGDNQ